MARAHGFEDRSISNQLLMLNALDKIEKIQQEQKETLSNIYLDVGKSIVSGQTEVISELKSQTTLLEGISEALKGKKKIGEATGTFGPAKDMIMQMAGVLVALGGAFLIFGNGLINVDKVDPQKALVFASVMLAIFSSISMIFREGIIISIKEAIKLAAVSTILAFSIEMVAQIFSRIPDVSLRQMITAIAISAALVPVVTNISQAVSSLFEDSSILGILGGVIKGAMTTVATLGALIVLPMIAFSIALSAGILSGIKPVSLKQIATMMLVSTAMIPMVYNFVKLMEALRGPMGMDRIFTAIGAKLGGIETITTKDASIGALILFPLISLAMVLSSAIFNMLPPPTYSFGSLVLVAMLAVAMVPMTAAFSLSLMALRGLTNMKSIFFAAAALPLIALSLVGVALVFKFLPKAFKNPDVKWAILAGLVLTTFAIPLRIIAGTFKNLKGADLTKMIVIALLILPAIAGAIVGVAYVFQLLPDEFKAPPLKWVLKAGFAMMIFGTPFLFMTILLRKLSFDDLINGVIAMSVTAMSIVGVAYAFQFLPKTLRSPDIGWTVKAGLAMMVFGIPFVFMTVLLKKLKIEDLLRGTLAMSITAMAIVGVAWVFQLLPKEMNAPPLMWTIRAGLALLAFAVPFITMSVIMSFIGAKGLTGLALGAVGMGLLALAIVGVAWAFQLLPKEFKIIPLAWAVGLAAASTSFVIIALSIGLIGLMVSAFTPVGFGLGILGILAIALAVTGIAWIFKLMPADIFKPGGVLYDVADAMAYFGYKIVDVFIYLVSKGMPYIMQFITFMVSDVIVSGLNGIVNMLSNFATKLIEAAIPLINAFLPYFQSFFTQFVEILKVGKDIVVAIISEVGEIIRTAINSFSGGVDAIGNFLLKMKEIGASDLLAIGGALVIVAGGIAAIMLALAGGNVMNAISGMVSGVAGAITGGLSKLVGIETEESPDDPIEVVMAVSSAVEKIAKYDKPINRIAKSFSNIAKDMGTFKDQFNKLDVDRLEKVNEMLLNAKQMAEGNQNVLTAVASGIQAGISSVGQTIKGVFSKDKAEAKAQQPVQNTQNAQLQLQLEQMNKLLLQLNSTMTQINTKLDGELNVKVSDNKYGIGT